MVCEMSGPTSGRQRKLQQVPTDKQRKVQAFVLGNSHLDERLPLSPG